MSIRCAAEMLAAGHRCLAVPDSSQVTCEFPAPKLDDLHFFPVWAQGIKAFLLVWCFKLRTF